MYVDIVDARFPGPDGQPGDGAALHLREGEVPVPRQPGRVLVRLGGIPGVHPTGADREGRQRTGEDHHAEREEALGPGVGPVTAPGRHRQGSVMATSTTLPVNSHP